jgi:hypothetical protein
VRTDRQPAAGIFVRDVMHKNCAVNQDCLWAVTNFVILFCRQAGGTDVDVSTIRDDSSGGVSFLNPFGKRHLALSCPSVRPSVYPSTPMEQRDSTGWTFAKIQFCLKSAPETDTLREELPIFTIHGRDWPFETVFPLRYHLTIQT